MTKWITMLAGVLVVQIAVAVSVNIGQNDYRAFEPEGKLLPFDMQAVDSIRIDGGDDTHVVLSKQDDQWRVPALNDFPADQGSVTRLIDRLATLDKGWPVATTKGAAKRFKVAETSFERKLTLLQDEKPQATLYLGTSPAFRKVHVRLPDETDIRAVAFNTYEVGVKPEDWIDKGILTHKADDIQRVELSGFTLQRQDDHLEVVGLAEDEATVTDEAKRLLERIAGLTIRAVLGTADTSHDGQNEADLRYTLALKSGATQDYTFSKPTDTDHYVLKVSHRDESFQVDTWLVDSIKEVTRDKLVRKKAKAPDAPAETPKEASQSTQQ
jgi:hypothetical protein